MGVIRGIGLGSQPLIVYKTNKQHPECQASTVADTVTSAAVRLHGSAVAQPGDFQLMKLQRWLPVLFSISRADFPLTTSFLQAKLKPCEALSFLFIIFNRQCYGINRSLVQGGNAPLAGGKALRRSSVQPPANPGHCPPWVLTGWASQSCEDIG